jgi:hypothetical protein
MPLAFSCFSYFLDRVSHFCFSWPQTEILLVKPPDPTSTISNQEMSLPFTAVWRSKTNMASTLALVALFFHSSPLSFLACFYPSASRVLACSTYKWQATWDTHSDNPTTTLGSFFLDLHVIVERPFFSIFCVILSQKKKALFFKASLLTSHQAESLLKKFWASTGVCGGKT